MFNLESIVRKNIRSLTPYSSARDEYTGKAEIFLDANESPYGPLNRYPDPHQRELRKRISVWNGVSEGQVFVGNGSDEVIDLMFRIFCEPGMDKALTFTPSYGMYSVSANIHDVELTHLPLDRNFQPELGSIEPRLKDKNLKLILFCSPNNPTGNRMNHILTVAKQFHGIVLVDEAYVDFSEHPSMIGNLPEYPNLILSRTFSKAWGMAAARVGYALGNPAIMEMLDRVKPPYNVSTLNQQAVLRAMNNPVEFEKNKKQILSEKLKLKKSLASLNTVKKIHPSEANFFLVEFTDANAIYDYLKSQKIIVRNRDGVVRNCLRITVGNPEENERLITALKHYTS
jgi:histidinol-phosphate aminotransferase